MGEGDEDRSGAGGVATGAATSLRRFLEMSIDLLAVLDLRATILEVSASWQRTFGWPVDHLVGTHFLDLFHPDDLPRVEAELVNVLAGGEALSVAVRMRASDGSYRWVQGNARADLVAERIYVTGADITQRKALEEALGQQLDLEELVASIASRLIGAGPGRIPAEIERGVAELAQHMGADRGHFLRGRRRPDDATYVEWRNPDTVATEHAPAPDPEVQGWWMRALRDQRQLCLEDVEDLAAEAPEVVAALRQDGVRSVLHVPLPLMRGHWGFITMVAVRDRVAFSDAAISLLRLAGECFMSALAQGDAGAALQDARLELESRNESLERSNEDLQRFAYAAAHDLKAPLARVEMALNATKTAPEAREELLDIARRGASRMRQLIEDLLTFSAVGKGAGRTGPVDLAELVQQVLGDLEPLITSAGVTVEVEPLPTVTGVRSLLGQLLQNLISNALKFRRPDGPARIEVSADAGGIDQGGTTVTVADNGIGIEAKERSKVFGVFTRLNSEEHYPGSGIGLATCAKVVAHHDGRIWIEDGIDGGVAVKVWLPDAAPDPEGR